MQQRPEAAALDALSGWPGLRTVLAIESIRSVNSAPTKVESEIRYFLSSCPDDPAALGSYALLVQLEAGRDAQTSDYTASFDSDSHQRQRLTAAPDTSR